MSSIRITPTMVRRELAWALSRSVYEDFDEAELCINATDFMGGIIVRATKGPHEMRVELPYAELTYSLDHVSAMYLRDAVKQFIERVWAGEVA